jgi:hypothetical protein
MPIKQYLLWVGGALLCLIFVLDAYLPKAAPHRDFDFDRTGLMASGSDTWIAPDTGAVAISGDPARDGASDPPVEEKVTAAPVAQAFAKLATESPKKQQRKRGARAQFTKPADRSVTRQYAWSSEWSSDWSSPWTMRGSLTDARRSDTMGEATKRPARYPRSGKVDPKSAGHNANCWFC